MRSAYDSMPIMRMSLENVARDFHMNIIAQHQEIQKYIEENLQTTIDNFIETEMPKLVNSIVSEAARKALTEQIGWRGENEDLRKLIDQAAEKALRKFIAESADEVAETAMYSHKDALKDKVKQSQIWRVLRAITGGED